MIPDEHVATTHPDRGGYFVQFDPIGSLQYQDVISTFEDAAQLIYLPIQQQHALSTDDGYLAPARIKHERIQIFPGADLLKHARVGAAMKLNLRFIGLKYPAETDISLEVGPQRGVPVGEGVKGDASDFREVESIVLVELLAIDHKFYDLPSEIL